MVNSLKKQAHFTFTHLCTITHHEVILLRQTLPIAWGGEDKWRQMLTPHTYTSAHYSQQKQTSRNHNPARLNQLDWIRPDTLTGWFCDYVQRQWLDHGKPGLGEVKIWRISVYCEHWEFSVKKSSQIVKCV